MTVKKKKKADNKDLQSNPYLKITYNGKEFKREYICEYNVKLNHFAVYFKLTQHCKLTMLQKKKQNTKLSIYNDHNFVNYTLGKHTKILTIFLD